MIFCVVMRKKMESEFQKEKKKAIDAIIQQWEEDK